MKKSILLFIFLCLLSNKVYTQEEQTPKYYIGGYAGLHLNNHKTGFGALPGYPTCCTEYPSGSGIGFAIGGLFEYPFNKQFSLETRIGYSTLNGVMKRDETIGNHLVDAGGANIPPEVDTEYKLESHLGLFVLEPTFNYRPIPRIIISAGFRLGFFASPTFNQEERIVFPNNVVFVENNQITRNVYNDEAIPEVNSMQFFTSLGVSYEFPIGDKWTFAPEGRFYLPLTKISSVDWQVSSAQLGAAVRYAFYPKKERPLIKEIDYFRDTTDIFVYGLDATDVKLISSDKKVTLHKEEDVDIERTVISERYERKIPQKAELKANLLTIGISHDGIETENPTIVIEEIETSEQFPLLPYVYFGENSSDLSTSAMFRLNVEDTHTFDEKGLRWDALDIYSNLLNIIGKRLRDNPNSNITITGTNNATGTELNNNQLSLARAQAVKDYFLYNWNISERRINVESRNLPEKPANVNIPQGIEENRRAEIYSDDYNILKPVELREIVRYANPPKVRITPEVVSDVPIDSWSLDILHNNIPLRQYNGKGKPDEVVWNIEEDPIPDLNRPANIHFNATDELKQRVDAERDINIEQLTIQRKKVERRANIVIERFSLVLFDFDKSELTPYHKRSLDEIKQRIKPNSKVIIQGYTDITGTPEYNRELAARRNNEVANYLRVPANRVVTENIGSNQLLYDNKTPQGRSYCRTVRITIETPEED